MSVVVNVAIPVTVKPNDLSWFRPVLGMVLSLGDEGLDLGKGGFLFMLCFRLDGVDAKKESETHVVVRDPDGKVVFKSPKAKPPLVNSPYDGAVNGWVLHELKGCTVKVHGPYTVQSYLDDELVKETIFHIEKPLQ